MTNCPALLNLPYWVSDSSREGWFGIPAIFFIFYIILQFEKTPNLVIRLRVGSAIH